MTADPRTVLKALTSKDPKRPFLHRVDVRNVEGEVFATATDGALALQVTLTQDTPADPVDGFPSLGYAIPSRMRPVARVPLTPLHLRRLAQALEDLGLESVTMEVRPHPTPLRFTSPGVVGLLMPRGKG